MTSSTREDKGATKNRATNNRTKKESYKEEASQNQDTRKEHQASVTGAG